MNKAFRYRDDNLSLNLSGIFSKNSKETICGAGSSLDSEGPFHIK